VLSFDKSLYPKQESSKKELILARVGLFDEGGRDFLDQVSSSIKLHQTSAENGKAIS